MKTIVKLSKKLMSDAELLKTRKRPGELAKKLEAKQKEQLCITKTC